MFCEAVVYKDCPHTYCCYAPVWYKSLDRLLPLETTSICSPSHSTNRRHTQRCWLRLSGALHLLQGKAPHGISSTRGPPPNNMQFLLIAVQGPRQAPLRTPR